MRTRAPSERPYAVHVCRPGEKDSYAALHACDGPVLGAPFTNGWIIFNHPDGKHGLVGRQLCEGPHSWQHAWDNEFVDIEIRTSSTATWQLIDDWEDILAVCTNT